MKPIKLVFWAAVLVVLLSCAVAAFPPGYLDSHRAALAAAAGEALGRPVSSADPVALVWSPGPSIAVDWVRSAIRPSLSSLLGVPRGPLRSVGSISRAWEAQR
jgi:hypothetical protein